MKIVIAGGTGFIGGSLVNYFAPNNQVNVLTRNVAGSNNAYSNVALSAILQPGVKIVQWDGSTEGEWESVIDGCDLLINLAGKSVNCRYTKENKREIIDSRVQPTLALGKAIQKANQPPKVWINASSATIYRHATDRAQDEYTDEMHDDFSVQVCKQWEHAFFSTDTPHTRKIAFRTAITLGTGGVMVPYLNLVKFGLGGRQGSGQQMYSWVHIHDVCRAMEYVFVHDQMNGVYNLSSPQPVTNRDFMATLQSLTKTPVALPAFTWMLQIGAILIGTETELLLKSRWVLPTRLLDAGFTFAFPELDGAMQNILSSLPKRQYKLFASRTPAKTMAV